MRGAVAPVERVHRCLDHHGHDLDVARKLGRHRSERGREGGDQRDAAGTCACERDRIVDHRLVGLQHRPVGPASRHRVDARTERRAGEQDRRRAGVDRVAGEREEAPGHALVEPGRARGEVGRQAVVEQVHPPRLGPGARELGIDRRDRVRERVNQRDPDAGVSHVQARRTRVPSAVPATTRPARPARAQAGRTSRARRDPKAPRGARRPSPARTRTSARASRT